MSILLRSDDRDEEGGNDNGDSSPLARYAAEYWMVHAQFEHVSSYLRTSMESLFDLDKPYFAAWLKLYNIDTPSPKGSTFYMFTSTSAQRRGSPLYYAALCGFQDLVQKLIIESPQHVNDGGGWYVRPLVAALAGKHFRTAELLRLSGADPNVRCFNKNTPLHSAACYGDVEMVQVLLNLGADVYIRNGRFRSPLHFVSIPPYDSERPNSPRSFANVARLLLDRCVDINARDDEDRTALHTATNMGEIEVIHVLLEHGANVGAKDKRGRISFSLAKERRFDSVIKLLSEHGAQ